MGFQVIKLTQFQTLNILAHYSYARETQIPGWCKSGIAICFQCKSSELNFKHYSRSFSYSANEKSKGNTDPWLVSSQGYMFSNHRNSISNTVITIADLPPTLQMKNPRETHIPGWCQVRDICFQVIGTQFQTLDALDAQ